MHTSNISIELTLIASGPALVASIQATYCTVIPLPDQYQQLHSDLYDLLLDSW